MSLCREKDEFTVYVNNLPFTCTEEALRAHFKGAGDIVEVRLIRNTNGQIKGFAYIQFREKHSVQLAISTLHKSKMEQRTIIVEPSTSKKDIGYSVHVNNLSFKVTDEELRGFCEERFGQVKMVHLVKDEHARSKGFAFVEFVEEDGMNKAVREKEIDLHGRIAIIKRSTR